MQVERYFRTEDGALHMVSFLTEGDPLNEAVELTAEEYWQAMAELDALTDGEL